ncbi:hypothetical protein ASF70_19020 [Rhizobium sp. Leaf321]|uniref:hypothetical protein n=1 Tax=Rhizobium sp. Leaf321 TaxID=1736335 RepID=UPI0007140CBB|nr:hypothetical protein [Rhizobium sp. Leaf321]KQQ70937.1 hypothetical protein ASF70_19020 [Rhizobium sp. Leaf321]
MTQKQSPAYPNFSLEKAIDLARQIFEKDRKNPIDRDVAARHIGYGGTSGAADKTLATLAHYGLVERAGKGQLRVTQTLVDIIFPDSEHDKRAALKEAGFSPSVFNVIRSRFSDGTPSEAALRGWLVRENFLDRAIGPVAKAYLDTVRYLEQSKAFESGSDDSDFDASPDESITRPETNQVHSTNFHPTPPAIAAPAMELNIINAEISGDTVKVTALLDREGLEKLEKKIAFLKDFLSV